MDELDARVRALEAERLRPVPPPPGPVTGISRADLVELCALLGEDEPLSGVVVRKQQPPDVLPGVAGQLDQLDLPHARVAGLPERVPERPVAVVEPPLSGLVPSYGCADVRHCLLLIHGHMFSHVRVATLTMIPP